MRMSALPKRALSVRNSMLGGLVAAVLILVLGAGCGETTEPKTSASETAQADEAPPPTLEQPASPEPMPPAPTPTPPGPAPTPDPPADPAPASKADAQAFLLDFVNARAAGSGADGFLSANADELFSADRDLALYPSIESYRIRELTGADANSFEAQLELVTPEATIVETVGVGPGENVNGRAMPLVVRFAVLDSLEVRDADVPADMRQPRWPNRPELPEGEPIPIRDFNRFLNVQKPAWAESPLLVTIEFLQLGRPEGAAQTTISLERTGGVSPSDARALVITEGLFDDSVAAQRFELDLRRARDGTWRLRSATWTQRCHPGRGQQIFSSDYCV